MADVVQKRNLIFILGFALFIALSGAFLLMPANHEPSLGFFVWTLFILIGNLALIRQVFGKLRITVFNILILLSFFFLSCGFMISTKEHAPSLLLQAVLLVILNLNLLTPHFESNFVPRYLSALGNFIITKIFGVFDFFEKFAVLQIKGKTKGALKSSLSGVKTTLLFAVTGLPLIILVISLLQNTNERFALWVDELFSFEVSLGLWFQRLIFIVICTVYFITEIWLLKKVTENSKEWSVKEIKTTDGLHRHWLAAGFFTVLLLNIFYVVFVTAELRDDLFHVSNLAVEKGYDSYSQLAVARFWELIMVNIINLGLVYLLAQSFWNWRKNNSSKTMLWLFLGNAVFLFLNTVFLIFSSHQRLSLYEDAYGFTFKRLSAHSFLPILLIVTVLMFSAFIWRKYAKSFHMAFGILIFYIALFSALPVDYITNRANLSLLEQEKIQVYDPYYTIDAESDDGLLIALELLRKNGPAFPEAESLRRYLKEFQQKYQTTPLREWNLMRRLISKKARELSI